MKDFKITQEGGHWIARQEGLEVGVVGDGGQLFHRRAVKIDANGQRTETMLVARLDGVSVYIQDGTIVVTKEDIYL